jgi:hypothetical protein
LLFADTLVEDADLYRFLVEGAADVLGVPASAWRHLSPLWESMPPLKEESARKLQLAELAKAAQLAVPGLVWLQDGRNIWDVFKAERFLGNARAAKCSHVLKQEACRRWLKANAPPAETFLHVGIHWVESHHYYGSEKMLGVKEHWRPWACEAPMCDPPHDSPAKMFDDLAAAGIARSRAYDDGWEHSNCSGACVKQGQAGFLRLLEKRPDVYAYVEAKEQEMRDFLGKDVAILRDRRGGQTKPLPLSVFRERSQQGQACDPTET